MKITLETGAQKGNLMFAISAALNLGAWVIIALNISAVTFPAIVHYNVFFGRDLLGETSMLFLAPLLGAIILAVNFWIFRILSGAKQEFLSLLVAGTNIFIQALVFLAARIAILANT